MANKIKIIAGLLIAGQLVIPSLAFAAVNAVPTYDSGNTVDNAIFNAAFQSAKTTYETTCLTPIKTFEAKNITTSLGFNFLSIIGGGANQLLQLNAQVSAYESFILCAETSLEAFNGTPLGGTILGGVSAPNVYTANIKNTYVNQINSAIDAYKTKLQSALAKQANASQGFWKTLVFNILIQTPPRA